MLHDNYLSRDNCCTCVECLISFILRLFFSFDITWLKSETVYLLKYIKTQQCGLLDLIIRRFALTSRNIVIVCHRYCVLHCISISICVHTLSLKIFKIKLRWFLKTAIRDTAPRSSPTEWRLVQSTCLMELVRSRNFT